MRVVIFCGGLGTRLRDFSEEIPKPLVPLDAVPIVSHVMKYYAFHGHRDFILCLGYKAEIIKQYFMNCPERLPGDVVIEHGAECIRISSDCGDCRIAFADTGLISNFGQRLKAVEPFLKDQPIFLANYADGLTDFPLPDLIREFKTRHAAGMFLSVHPNCSFHFVRHASDGRVLAVEDIVKANARINGGYFVFSNEIFDCIRPGEELVEQPFERLIDQGKLFAIDYDGFWRCVDTFKDLQALENLVAAGHAPWMVWQRQKEMVYGRTRS
jgi:glucose-1-phosphate cytidylyltransferase